MTLKVQAAKEDLQLYTISELSQILNVSERTLLRYLKAGKLKGVKIGGKWRISEDNYKKFINAEI